MKYLWELSRTKTKTLKLAFALSGPILFALWWRWIQQQGGERQLRPCYLLHWGKSHNIFSCVWIWREHWRDIKNVENHKMKMISSVGFLQLLVIWLFCARVFTSPHHRLAAWLTVVKFIFWHLYPHSLHIYENMSARDGENKAESINSRGSHLPHTSCLGGIRNIFWRMHTT